MKKFLSYLCALLMVPTVTFAATPSPVANQPLYNSEGYKVAALEDFFDFDTKLLEEYFGESEYELCEAFECDVTKAEIVKWIFPTVFNVEDKLFMLLIGESVYGLKATTDDEYVYTDFSEVEPGNYVILVFKEKTNI